MSLRGISYISTTHRGPFPNTDQLWSHQRSVAWNNLVIPKLQRLHCWNLGMNNSFHPTFYDRCNYLSAWWNVSLTNGHENCYGFHGDEWQQTNGTACIYIYICIFLLNSPREMTATHHHTTLHVSVVTMFVFLLFKKHVCRAHLPDELSAIKCH